MKSPFKGSPNPNLAYLTPTLNGALEKIRFMIEDRQGLAIVLGDNGMGKSTILRYLLAEYSSDTDAYVTAMLPHTEFPSPFALLKAISAQFGLEAERSRVAQHQALEYRLQELNGAGKTTILFVDEGQRLSAELLEVIRALLNLEDSQDKYLQIVMAGTLKLRDNILAKRNRALKSRVFAPCMLVPLGQSEVASMIEFRCQRAGIPNPFEPGCAELVYAFSGGIPRDAMRICAHAWNLAKRIKLPRVPPDLVEAAHHEASVEAEAVSA